MKISLDDLLLVLEILDEEETLNVIEDDTVMLEVPESIVSDILKRSYEEEDEDED